MIIYNVRKLFKKGSSSPSKDPPNPFANDNAGIKGSPRAYQSAQRRALKIDDQGSGSSREHTSFNEHHADGRSPRPTTPVGSDKTYGFLDRARPSSPACPTVNGRPVTDPKVLQLLGTTEDDENGMSKWIPTKEGVDNFPSRYESGEESGSPDAAGEGWPQKSELPPSFEFARPAGQDLGDDIDIGESMPSSFHEIRSPPKGSTLDVSHAFPFTPRSWTRGEEITYDPGTATGSGGDSSVESVEDLTHVVRTAAPIQSTYSPKSGPSNGHSSSSQASNHSKEGRSWVPNGTRGEGASWGSPGPSSPRWQYSGQPSPERGNRTLHKLPAPPVSPSAAPPVYLNATPSRGSNWPEASSREWQGQYSSQNVFSPSQQRMSPRLTARPAPLVSPLPSPPRSPQRSPRQQSISRLPWTPFTTPFSNNSSYQSPPRSPPWKPKTPEKWKRIKQIGTGSFGTVHEAINLDDGSFFAVKVSHDESIPPEIQKEIEVLSTLRHPNVVQYLGTAMEDGHLCIFLELMQNSLQSIVRVHRFDETLISTYTRQILQGLEYLHQTQTIHRDIKCANILVDKDGQVKLADFGLAKEVGMSLATSVKGTPYFMAPEILKPVASRSRGYSFSVDIWSLGCTVLEMADGQPPWSCFPGFGFFFKISKGELPPIPQHLSLVCQNFIKRCLQFNPEDRPTASQLLLDPFVANAPRTAAAAATVSPSPAAIYMRGPYVESPRGGSGDVHRLRNGSVFVDVQGPDSARNGYKLQRSPRIDKSIKRSSSGFPSDTDAAPYHSNQAHSNVFADNSNQPH